MAIRVSDISKIVPAIQEWMQGLVDTSAHSEEEKREGRILPRFRFDKYGARFDYIVMFKGGGYGEHGISRSWPDIEQFLVEKKLI